jgi:hypothetical protein
LLDFTETEQNRAGRDAPTRGGAPRASRVDRYPRLAPRSSRTVRPSTAAGRPEAPVQPSGPRWGFRDPHHPTPVITIHPLGPVQPAGPTSQHASCGSARSLDGYHRGGVVGVSKPALLRARCLALGRKPLAASSRPPPPFLTISLGQSVSITIAPIIC